MKFIKNQGIKIEDWNAFIQKSNQASPFQTPLFYNFFKNLEGFMVDVFAFEEEKSITSLVVVVIQKEKGIKSYFSKRGIIYGGPLFSSKESAFKLLKFITDHYRKKLIYLETRNFFDYSNYKEEFLKLGWDYLPWLNYQLPIISEEQIKKTISQSRWRQINKAKKSGVYWDNARTLDEVEVFYSMLKDLYKKKVKKPLPPWRFFKDFYLYNTGVYLLIYYNNKIIGGIMCPVLPKKAIYEFYVCGLDQEYKDQYPSVMATWAAIEFALMNDIILFDFMGAGSPYESYGVRDFKSRFGGEEVEHGRFIKILNPFLYKLGKLGLKILSTLK